MISFLERLQSIEPNGDYVMRVVQEAQMQHDKLIAGALPALQMASSAKQSFIPFVSSQDHFDSLTYCAPYSYATPSPFYDPS